MKTWDEIMREVVTSWDEGAVPSWWWLSFVDGNRPAGQKFLGVCIVSARTFVEAVLITHSLGINPGGEVQGMQLPNPIPPCAPSLDGYTDRLLSLSDLESGGFNPYEVGS